jgi:hypothetical protein
MKKRLVCFVCFAAMLVFCQFVKNSCITDSMAEATHETFADSTEGSYAVMRVQAPSFAISRKDDVQTGITVRRVRTQKIVSEYHFETRYRLVRL